jgi:Domain of unknown function (DUF4190)
MSYPPQGGWQQDQQGGWQQPQPGGWQDPAGGYQSGYADPASSQPTYTDPASSQPAYIDPVSGQPTSYPGYGAQPPAYPTSPSYGYGYQQAYPGYGAPLMPAATRTNGLAVAAMVVALVGLPFLVCYGAGGVLGLVGAILGHIAQGQVKSRGEQGGGMALTGIIVGWITVVIALAVVAFFVFFVWYVVNSVPNYPYSTPT